MKQAYEYYDRIHCKYKRDVKLIFIVISKKGKLKEYTTVDITFHPQIIKTKKINKQKDLSIIRDKFKRDIKLTLEESSLLVALPLFELKESEAEITEEICSYIKYKKHCIPADVLNEIGVATFFNITEYVEFEKQENLLEMISMAEQYNGLLAQIRNEGRMAEKKDIIELMLKGTQMDTVCSLLHMTRGEIESILKK